MGKFSRVGVGGVALSASLVLVGTAAIGATGVIHDPVGDAVVVVNDGLDYGDFDIDLTRIDIDHGTKRLDITAQFTNTVEDSWNLVNAELDTNRDGFTDYTATWVRGYDENGNLEEAAWVTNAYDEFTCRSIGTAERLGRNGTLALRIPRSCIGTPRQVAVHVDVMWGGYNTYGDELYFIDSAPGELIDERTTFSAPVLSSNTGTATSPAPPKQAKAKTKTRTTAKFAAKKRVATVRVKVTSPTGNVGRVAGKVRIQVRRGNQVVRTVTKKVNNKGIATVKVKKKFLKRKGNYKVVGRYLGTNKHVASSNNANFRVRTNA